MRLRGESFVFIGDQPSRLALLPAPRAQLELRSTYQPQHDTIHYAAGRDYVFDASQNALIRLPGSRLPDFRTNVLYGQRRFDHTRFPGYGNLPFFAYADYNTSQRIEPRRTDRAPQLRGTRAKMRSGAPLKIVAFGDSITWGGEASAARLIFWQRWVRDLRANHPHARITAHNGATGGDTTTQGLQRLDEKVLRLKPDLVLVGFGMNDHNRGSIALPRFRRQLREIVKRIRATGAEVILYPAFPPNPLWLHSAHRMERYAAATRDVAGATDCAFANVFAFWQHIATRKRPEDLLANNINHPNDFGHWIYYQALAAVLR
jgi:acyl-CoA thioesterase-1